ncbi:hypothetical protein AB7M35_002152 [Amorphus suaedae]
MSLDPSPVPYPAPPVDGRQSQNALKVRRGTCRLLRMHGFSTLPEVGLASGRRADLVAIGKGGEIWIVEIKSSLEDLRADAKWPFYRLHCDRLFFATLPEVPSAAFPEEAGLILTDGFQAEILREAPTHRLAAATRKAMLLKVAQLASSRLHLLEDPEAAHLELPVW